MPSDQFTGAEQSEIVEKPKRKGFILIGACVLTVFLLCYFLAPIWAMLPLAVIVFVEPGNYAAEKKFLTLLAILIIGLFSFFYGFKGEAGGGAFSSVPVMQGGYSGRPMPASGGTVIAVG